MKLCFSHPGVGPFVQQTARTLLEAELLASYWTTFVDQPDARWRKTAVRLGRAIGVDLDRELRRRGVTEIPTEFLRTNPSWEVLRSVLAKAKVDPRLVDAVWERGTLLFDRHVARHGLEGAGGIYAYGIQRAGYFSRRAPPGLGAD